MNKSGQKKQQGAAMVEFAFTVSLFFLLVFAIIEFSLLLMSMARTNEITRELARIAIVRDPVCDIHNAGCPGGGGLSCPSNEEVIVTLDQVNADCGSDSEATSCLMLNAARRHMSTVEPEQIEVRYACSSAGSTLRPEFIPLVTVGLLNVNHSFILSGYPGLPAGIVSIPEFQTTRIGEDMYTEHQ